MLRKIVFRLRRYIMPVPICDILYSSNSSFGFEGVPLCIHAPSADLAQTSGISPPVAPTIEAKNDFQLLKIATYSGWNYLSYLNNRSQFSRYYFQGSYNALASSLWYRPQIAVAQNIYIPNNLTEQNFSNRMRSDMKTSSRGMAPLYGVSLVGSVAILKEIYEEAPSQHRNWFGGASALDLVTTVSHAQATHLIAQATEAHENGNISLAVTSGQSAHYVYRIANVIQMLTSATYFVDQVLSYSNGIMECFPCVQQTSPWD